MAFPVLYNLQLPGDVPSLERRVLRLTAFRQKDCQSVLISVECEVLSDQFVDDEVLV